jgi:hypothetical protein
MIGVQLLEEWMLRPAKSDSRNGVISSTAVPRVQQSRAVPFAAVENM